MKTLLALIDFSDATAQIIDRTHELAKAFGSDVVLMNVMPPWPVAVDLSPLPDPDPFHERQRQLFALRDSLSERDVKVTALEFEGSVLDCLLDQVDLLKPDMIIMGSHAHGSLYNLIVGSVTAGVIRQAPCPVLLIPKEPAPVPDPGRPIADPGTMGVSPAFV